MSVFAGTGRAGLADGPRASAEFVLPTAMTSDTRGNLYVADSAAQRVRMISPTGNVTTLAGSGILEASRLWVQPGYRDGPARQAQFSKPSGLAVGPAGELYIADSGNYCIRVLKDGMVSTFAGICGTSGAKDGTRTEALFSYPRQIVCSAAGDLYVADFHNGVRKVDPAGNVSTLPVSVDKRVTGVAVAGNLLFVADPTGITTISLPATQIGKIPKYYTAGTFPPPLAGGLELGSPYALATGPGADGVFYTDLNADAVRRFIGSWLEYTSGVPREDAPLGSAYLSSTPALHGPMGITLDDRGALYVADSGHKRIITIQGLNRQRGFLPNPMSLLTLQPKRHAYRILIIGNSFVWFTNQETDSIGARLRRALQRPQPINGPVFEVLSLEGSAIGGQASLAKEIISSTDVDFVVIFVTSFDMWHFQGTDFKEQFRKQEVDTVSALQAASKACLFVFIPTSGEATPYEQLYASVALSGDTPINYGAIPRAVVEQLNGIGPPILDLFPAVQAYEADAYVQPLYNNYDLHPNANGREFIAEHIAALLLKMEPWKSRPTRQ